MFFLRDYDHHHLDHYHLDPPRPPTSRVDSLVCFFGLVTHHVHQLYHCTIRTHQRVALTRWWFFFLPRHSPHPPTSCVDSLVGFRKGMFFISWRPFLFTNYYIINTTGMVMTTKATCMFLFLLYLLLVILTTKYIQIEVNHHHFPATYIHHQPPALPTIYKGPPPKLLPVYDIHAASGQRQ